MIEREGLAERLVAALAVRIRMLARERLLSLMARVTSVRDPALQARSFLQSVGEHPPSLIAEMLHGLEIMAIRRNPVAQKLHLALLDERLLEQVFSPGTIREIWREGRIRAYGRMLEAFFCIGTPDSRLEQAVPLPPDIRDIPLGRRKALAKTREIMVLERLLKDNDVSVVRNLLANPRLTEQEVVTLVARRPNSAAVLSEVASHRRWVSRYRIKKALVFNPETPVRISMPLLKYFLRADLMAVCRSSSSELLKQRARQIIRARADAESGSVLG